MPRNNEMDPLIGEYEHESHRRRADEALHTIRKIASMVKPIMRRRNLYVGTLAEFYPRQGNLLGLNTNHGEMIQIRLRYAGDETQFLPFEEVCDTMLHELCHNRWGPHDRNFHNMWNELRDELTTLIMRGYSGEGFLGRGERLGGQKIPMQEARRRARAAAEKRRTLTGGSGQRLGGRGVMRGEDPRQVIINAIERRKRVLEGCATGTEAGIRLSNTETRSDIPRTITRATHDENEEAMIQAYIDLIDEESGSKGRPAGSAGTSTTSLIEEQREIEQNLKQNKTAPSIPTKTKPQRDPPPTIVHKPPHSNSVAPDPATWTCTTCTLMNPTKAPSCSACGTTNPTHLTNHDPRPQPPPDIDMDIDTWTCDICTLVNPYLHLSCNACGTERPESSFSHHPQNHSSRAQSTSSSRPKVTHKSESALKPRLNTAQALEKFEHEGAYKKKLPVGWQCVCGNWMEQQWWTCSVCSRMKASS